MIVTCPACETRYLFNDTALGGPEGRWVRCASCGNTWHYSPEAAAIHAAVMEVTASAKAAAPAAVTGFHAEPKTEPPPRSADPTAIARPSIAIELPTVTHRRDVRVSGLRLILLAAGILLVAILGRDKLLALLPSTASGAGLEITTTATRSSDSLLVTGDIVNSAAVPRRVPRLRVTLRDGNKIDLDSKVIDPPIERLRPGADAHFNTSFDHPSTTATGVAVTFAAE